MAAALLPYRFAFSFLEERGVGRRDREREREKKNLQVGKRHVGLEETCARCEVRSPPLTRGSHARKRQERERDSTRDEREGQGSCYQSTLISRRGGALPSLPPPPSLPGPLPPFFVLSCWGVFFSSALRRCCRASTSFRAAAFFFSVNTSS